MIQSKFFSKEADLYVEDFKYSLTDSLIETLKTVAQHFDYSFLLKNDCVFQISLENEEYHRIYEGKVGWKAFLESWASTLEDKMEEYFEDEHDEIEIYRFYRDLYTELANTIR